MFFLFRLGGLADRSFTATTNARRYCDVRTKLAATASGAPSLHLHLNCRSDESTTYFSHHLSPVVAPYLVACTIRSVRSSAPRPRRLVVANESRAKKSASLILVSHGRFSLFPLALELFRTAPGVTCSYLAVYLVYNSSTMMWTSPLAS